MSLEQLSVEIPEFPYETGDDIMQASRVHREVGTEAEAESTGSQLGKIVFEHSDAAPQLTFEYDGHYDEYVAAGKDMLEVAILTEQVYGLVAAVDKYRKASIKFIGAIGARDELDPDILILHANCLVKEVQSGEVRPYRDKHDTLTTPAARNRNRYADIQQSARDSYDLAWSMLMNDPEETKNEDHLVRSAVIISNGLEILDKHREAKDVLREARRKQASDHDTDSELVAFIDGFALTPEHKRPVPKKEVVAEALLGLATGEPHEILPLV